MTEYDYSESGVVQVYKKSVASTSELKPDFYMIEHNQMIGFHLVKTTPFESEERLYGETTSQVYRILETFKRLPAQMGTLLSGTKGSGKSLLAREVCIKAVQDGYPVLIVNTPWRGPDFESFLKRIDTPVVMMFDEFEKTYAKKDDDDPAESILTLFDGTDQSKRLYLLTVNNSPNPYLIDRPGRMRYLFKFDGISKATFTEYVEDQLEDKSKIDELTKIYGVFGVMTFDILKNIVSEMNMWNCSAKEALMYLNASPATLSPRYMVSITKNGETIEGFNPIATKNPHFHKQFEIYSSSVYFYTTLRGSSTVHDFYEVDECGDYINDHILAYDTNDIIQKTESEDFSVTKHILKNGLVVSYQLLQADNLFDSLF